ncbi:MAG: hypothetical protein IPL78_33800 [Chloroflexi bacterium]|nr:hypothetical protein [Chloroflexota bacterium]
MGLGFWGWLGQLDTAKSGLQLRQPLAYTVTLVTTNACGTDTFVDTVTVGTVTPPDIEVYLPMLIKED